MKTKSDVITLKVASLKAKPPIMRAELATLCTAWNEISCWNRFTALLPSEAQCYMRHNTFS